MPANLLSSPSSVPSSPTIMPPSPSIATQMFHCAAKPATHPGSGRPKEASAGTALLCTGCGVESPSVELDNGMCIACYDLKTIDPSLIEVGSRLLSHTDLDPQRALYWATLMITRASYERTTNRIGMCLHCDKLQRLPSARAHTCIACAKSVRNAL